MRREEGDTRGIRGSLLWDGIKKKNATFSGIKLGDHVWGNV